MVFRLNHHLHHAVTDLPEDISSPKQGGFWWAHLRWLYQTEPADKKHWAPELTGGIYRIWGWAETPVNVLSVFIGLILGLGWMGFFWMGALRLVYSLHLQCLVNSLTHLGEGKEGDSSINVWWLGPFQLTAWGENWHKNHYTPAGSARLGLRWYQTDRHRLVLHLDAGSYWPGALRQASPRLVTGRAACACKILFSPPRLVR